MEKNSSHIKFSIIIPCWNNEETLDKTLHSVLQQSYENYEIILIVRDKKVGFDYTPDECITVVEQQDTGVSNARNLGLQYATGTHVCFLDADDTWCCTYLEYLVKTLKYHPKVPMIIHNFYWRTKNHIHIKNKQQKSGLYDYFKLFGEFNQFFSLLSAMCFRNVWTEQESSVLFNSNMRLGEDVDFITKFALDNPMCYYDNRPCVTYRAPEKAYKKYTTQPVRIPALGYLLKSSDDNVLNYLDVWAMSTCLQNIDRGHSVRALVCLDFVSDKYKAKRRMLRLLCYLPHPFGLWVHLFYNRFIWK